MPNVSDYHDLSGEQVFLRLASEDNSHWSRKQNLDDFFKRIYKYHQNCGFLNSTLKGVMQLLRFLFVVFLFLYLTHCIRYDILFNAVQMHNMTISKTPLSETVMPLGQCIATASGGIIFLLIVCSMFWFAWGATVVYNFVHNLEIRKFFMNVLYIEDSELPDMQWHDVQRKILHVHNTGQAILIQGKSTLNELDIYHRILRKTNYMVALINKNILTTHISFPCLGKTCFFTNGLLFNYNLFLFRNPWGPFDEVWRLREDYKDLGKRDLMVKKLSGQIFWLGMINLIFSPLIFIWQAMYFFLFYTELLKHDPKNLSARYWSLYARHYLRHFNELDDQLTKRLNKAYVVSKRYCDLFYSRLLVTIAETGSFFSGAILAILLLFIIIDEDVFQVDHMTTLIACLAATFAVCRACIPGENLVLCQDVFLPVILDHVHYLPEGWKDNAFKLRTYAQFSEFFQYKIVLALQEVFSPFVTPFVLMFKLAPNTPFLVDFLRDYTSSVEGIGDVCSFACLNLDRHGDPSWSIVEMSTSNQSDGGRPSSTAIAPKESTGILKSSKNPNLAAHGKCELSIANFADQNPHWVPETPQTKMFVDSIHQYVSSLRQHRDATFSLYGGLDLPSVIFPSPANQNTVGSTSQQHSQQPTPFNVLGGKSMIDSNATFLSDDTVLGSGHYCPGISLVHYMHLTRSSRARSSTTSPDHHPNNEVGVSGGNTSSKEAAAAIVKSTSHLLNLRENINETGDNDDDDVPSSIPI